METKQKKKVSTIKTLAPCLIGYKKASILSIVTVLGESIMDILIPFVMKDLLDIGISQAKQGDLSVIFQKGGIMIGMAVFSLILGALCAKYASVASTGFSKGIRNTMFNKIQGFSFSNIDRFSTASLVTRLTNDITNVQNAYQMIIRMCVRAPIMLILATILAISINPELAIVFAFALPILVIAFVFLVTKTFPRFKKMLKMYDSMNAGIQENLIGIRIVKAFVRDKYETKRFNERADDVYNTTLAAEKLLVLSNPISMFVLYACLISVCALGGNQIINGTMSPGEFTSFISYVSQILMSVMMISMVFVQLVLTRASLSRIVEVISEKSDISDENANAELTVKDGSVDFNHVSFSYGGDKYVLSDINLHIKSGETIGILGGTGSAKTSLVQLIPRLYEASSGSVSVSGHDVAEYKLQALRGAIAVVLQKNTLFSGTILDNLRWGNETATMEEVTAAAKKAQAHDFIMSFPDGYNTDLGQGGVNVSGGQKQRLCIARALLKNPKIIILDDSTSAVDMTTDANIRAALKNDLSHITTIIIAQRVASVMEADKIVVLDEGKIVDIGTHNELLNRCSIYREVNESQTQKEEK